MNQLNTVILVGNVTENPEYFEKEKVCRFNVAVTRYYKNGDGHYEKVISYFDCECFGNLAEKFHEKIEKGRGIRLIGRLTQKRWKDGEDKNHSAVCVVVENIEVKPRKEQ